ncbi:hypothetical protein [Alienimonas sp. DA493]|uniref:hypothetical protein n=1 Tax=Alienimonas sp. DA493 TaxID=3373605 RepID=UPI0037542769
MLHRSRSAVKTQAPATEPADHYELALWDGEIAAHLFGLSADAFDGIEPATRGDDGRPFYGPDQVAAALTARRPFRGCTRVPFSGVIA